MAKFSTQKIDVWFEQFDNRIDALPGIIGEMAVEYYKERFIQRNWEGTPWKPHKKPQGHELLMKTKNLFSSVNASYPSGNMVRISAGRNPKVTYARIHNEGGRVRGIQYVKPHHNTNFMGKGRRVQIQGYARKVDFQMPKRQFIGPSATLNNQIAQRIKTFLNSKS